MQRITHTLRLPHPYYVTYGASPVPEQNGSTLYQIHQKHERPGKSDQSRDLAEPLQNASLSFSEPQCDRLKEQDAAEGNTPWARAPRYPVSHITWGDENVTTEGQIWLAIYFIFTIWPSLEMVKITLQEKEAQHLVRTLLVAGLAVEEKLPASRTHPASPLSLLLVPQNAFWQGAGSPLGHKVAWAPDLSVSGRSPGSLTTFPPTPLQYTSMTGFLQSCVHARHPVRSLKPGPSSIVYSRYIPHLDEMFSMVVIDYNDEEHVRLFNKWQNDPWVAKG